MTYLFLKWLHIIAIISWMAGVLYLYRLLVYHAEKGLQSHDNHELLMVMERKLYRLITTPAMIVAWLAGLAMLHLNPGVFSSGVWLHVKIFFVLLLTGATHYAGALVKKFSRKESSLPQGRTLRILNELPTLLMMIIVALVVFRPF